MKKLNELDKKTLTAVNKDLALWTNKVFKVEIDVENEQIKIISKRKSMKGKGFIIPLFEELATIKEDLLEKYIYSKYTTEVFLYL